MECSDFRTNDADAPLALPLPPVQKHHRSLTAEGEHATSDNRDGELMGVIVPLDRERSRMGIGRTRPARMSVTIDEVASVIRLRVNGARTPTRLYLYVDGDLVDTWVDVEGSYDASKEGLAAGRHAVTARAVDALGRWAGASTILER